VAGRPLALPGAHCLAGGMNRRGIGIALIGNLDAHPPLPAQFTALVEVLRTLAAAHGIPPADVLGHREVPGAATLCPGRYVDMEEVRRRLFSPSPSDGRRPTTVYGAYRWVPSATAGRPSTWLPG